MDGWGVDAEIYINLDSAKMQSKKYNVTFYEEVRRLLIHGTLHLLGYNDLTVRQRKQMTEKEDYYLSKLVKKGNEKRCKGI
jgi:rRNA maturation RNase YbeY